MQSYATLIKSHIYWVFSRNFQLVYWLKDKGTDEGTYIYIKSISVDKSPFHLILFFEKKKTTQFNVLGFFSAIR